MAAAVAVLGIHRVAVVATGAVVAAVAVVVRHGYSSRVTLAVMVALLLLAVGGGIVHSSAGLNLIVQLETDKEREL